MLSPPSANPLFPVFLKLEQLRVLLVGGGNVGLEKLTAILRSSPATAVTVVSITFLPTLRELAARYPQVQLREEPYTDELLEQADIVFAATDDPALHARIKQAARSRHLLVNVADTPPLCDFYLSSVVQKGALKIAVSTNGQSPTVAKRVRAVLEEALPEELDAVLQKMPAIRQQLTGDFAAKVRTLNAVTAGLAGGPGYEAPATRRWRRLAWGALLAAGALATVQARAWLSSSDSKDQTP
ncbi:bifunctional precorrin-2 dehydrogenase/sirohydrochlorin ferrochelatase [Hymenobacter sp. BT18]|uniref:precorrin-2 dehydrogenase/sirohydrochlorin ferrochelatase family protein n=1 Tax=Hymenobacter sp. BT18 TaxID=2835648 RepID=UPI00143E8FBF|nr:bifunctional precorrin-2 dehydrogenase/sirohydrochlorin ferrochelatase [Hymenobacter sp. BT18]QIX62214.1 bifunctional precorrin-2 dehydrogenase/sirohydrochlorin ferrochelatase [Hymenobacter sp. BT18]